MTTKPAAPLDLTCFDGYTPGPWFVGGSDTTTRMWVTAQLGVRICTMTPRDNDSDCARLIAAAPALLALARAQAQEIARLREALLILTDWTDENVQDAGATIPINQARAALAKVQP